MTQYEIMVTSGANQAFVNLVLSLVDAKDRVVLFAPYYFNHLMALQMTGTAQGTTYSSPLHPLCFPSVPVLPPPPSTVNTECPNH